ncbi:pectate lyase [uncultured Fibrobacter sp.]|uniref:pectate lyase family protein n=1 Tax=uncultured Fibrobacter sp. TaxID=261512 RepID=UPI0025E3341A|nr:pectate lyase [uncultured Fibrobacter sp.]
MKLAFLLAFVLFCSGIAQAAVDQCTPIGWATREGRTGGEFNVTGGGDATPVIVTSFTDLQKYAKDSKPQVIYIDGTLGSGWSGTTGDRLNITASNKTIIGLKPGTLLKAPIHITSKASNIIVRNIVIQGPGSNADQAWDNLTIEGEAKNIWIDHCEFWDGQDGNADVVKGADNVTFTWCIFGYKKKSTHNLSNLIGSSDNEPVSEGKLNVTYMFNWWQAANQRKPRCRYGNVHVVNNLLTGDASITNGTDVLGVSAGHMCTVRTERNVFINESNPIYTGNANGTGVNETIDNIFTNCSGNTKGTGKSFTPPYEYESIMLKASEVEAAVKAGAGANLVNPTECYSATEDTTVADTITQDSTVQDTTKQDSLVQDTASRDTAASDSIPQDSVVRDSTPEDTSSDHVVLKVADVSVQGFYRVSLFNTKGALVRRVDVLPAKIGNTAWITRSLPAGVYVMRVKAPGVDRRSFVVVK